MVIVVGTKADTVNEILGKLPEHQRKKAKEVPLDMAGNIALIAKKYFPKANQVTNRSHAQQLALQAVQDLWIEYRWQTLEAENESLEQTKLNQRCFPMAIR